MKLNLNVIEQSNKVFSVWAIPVTKAECFALIVR